MVNNLLYQSFKIPNRSGHYLGHHVLLTTDVGTLTPLLVHPVIPGTKVHLKALVSASLPPLATDAFLRTSMRLECFAVPLRFLYGGYESWVTREKVYNTSAAADRGVRLPYLALTGAQFKQYCKAGSLADFLGVRVNQTDMTYIQDTDEVRLNIFPFLAYRYIYDTWYRRADVQSPFFRRPASNEANNSLSQFLPYTIFPGATDKDFGVQNFTTTSLFPLLQRNFGIDYFTAAQLTAQLGDMETVKVETLGTDNVVTISALRSANSLQVFKERLGVSGPRFNDFLRSNYGTEISDSNGRRPMLLGSGSVEFYSKGVDQSYNSQSSGSISTNNPFKSVGATYGKPMCNGELSLADNFIAEEPMYIFVMCSCVPKVNYSSGVERYMLHYTHNGCEVDLANPILQNVGNQPVLQAELSPAAIREQNINDVFGYNQRYSEYMYRNDRVHSKFRSGENLASFVSQRYIAQSPVMGSNFLEIPKNYLDNVSAVTNQISQFGVMVDSFLDFSVSQPLYDSSIPSLVNPAEEHGREVVVMRGGKRII